MKIIPDSGETELYLRIRYLQFLFSEYPFELFSEYPFELFSEYPFEQFSEYPFELFSEYPFKLFSEYPFQLFSEYPFQLFSGYPFELTHCRCLNHVYRFLLEIYRTYLCAQQTNHWSPDLNKQYISSLEKDNHVQFTTKPFKPITILGWTRYPYFSSLNLILFNCGFSVQLS